MSFERALTIKVSNLTYIAVYLVLVMHDGWWVMDTIVLHSNPMLSVRSYCSTHHGVTLTTLMYVKFWPWHQGPVSGLIQLWMTPPPSKTLLFGKIMKRRHCISPQSNTYKSSIQKIPLVSFNEFIIRSGVVIILWSIGDEMELMKILFNDSPCKER